MRIVLRYRRLDGTKAVVAHGEGEVFTHDVAELRPMTRLDALDLAKRIGELGRG